MPSPGATTLRAEPNLLYHDFSPLLSIAPTVSTFLRLPGNERESDKSISFLFPEEKTTTAPFPCLPYFCIEFIASTMAFEGVPPPHEQLNTSALLYVQFMAFAISEFDAELDPPFTAT